MKTVKIITKNWKHLFFSQSLKFNEAQIKFNSKRIVLIKKSYINGIFLVTNYDSDFTNFQRIIKKKLSFKKLTQKTKKSTLPLYAS